MRYAPKSDFKEKIESLLENKQDAQKFWEIIEKPLLKTIRCNTLKISPEKLKDELEKKGWKILQPYPVNPEIMIIESGLTPGDLGKSKEHILGYYYVQETSSMMPMLALQPKSGELVLDLCASPGSKTTQACALMENKGTILANDVSMGRIAILSANLERQGCTNAIVTRHDAVQLCSKLKKLNFYFDKILLDVPCSGEGNIRSNPATFKMWNQKVIDKLGSIQKRIAESAIPLLKEGGELIYSTCTHSPEENEMNVNHLINRFGLKVEQIQLPVICRPGLTEWKGAKLSPEIKKACRIYPQDNNTEGFFLCKMKKTKREAAIVIFYDKEHFLIQDRKDISKWGEEYAYFGGRIEEGENPEQALKRELKEELEIEIKNYKLFKDYEDTENIGKDFSMNTRRVVFLAPMPNIEELKAGEGKPALMNFQDALSAKMIPGDTKLLQEVYEFLIEKGEIK
jgi:tRNA (cytosine49-C5)-methyltransferase